MKCIPLEYSFRQHIFYVILSTQIPGPMGGYSAD